MASRSDTRAPDWIACPDAPYCESCPCAAEDDVCFPGDRLRAELESATSERDRLRAAIENYILWEPGRRGHAAAHRELLAALHTPDLPDGDSGDATDSQGRAHLTPRPIGASPCEDSQKSSGEGIASESRSAPPSQAPPEGPLAKDSISSADAPSPEDSDALHQNELAHWLRRIVDEWQAGGKHLGDIISDARGPLMRAERDTSKGQR